MVGRGELTDKAWARIEPLLPASGRGGQWRDHRQVMNAILYKLRTGAPWPGRPPTSPALWSVVDVRIHRILDWAYVVAVRAPFSLPASHIGFVSLLGFLGVIGAQFTGRV